MRTVRDFKQCHVGPWVGYFGDSFIKRWKFKKYTHLEEPVVFFGINRQDQIINNHRGPKILITTGPADLPDWNIITNRKNLIIISAVDYLQTIIPPGVIFKREMIEMKDFSMFEPTPLGDKIYFYSRFSKGNEIPRKEDLYLISKDFGYEVITTEHEHLTDYYNIQHLKENYYDKSFLCMSLTPGMGMTTVREMALMGRKTLMNASGYMNIFNKATVWDYGNLSPHNKIEENIKVFKKVVKKEAEKIGTVQPSINVHTLTDDRWLYMDYYLKQSPVETI